MRPPSLTALEADSVPPFLTSAPTMPMRPLSATMLPRLVAAVSLPVISTRTPGVAVSPISTVLPAARIVSPPGVTIVPAFSTCGAIRYTLPPVGVEMVPSLRTKPAPGVFWKTKRLARKSASDICSDEATKWATSIRAPAPTRIPAGLIRKTWPFDCSWPRITEGSLVTTRLSTDEAAEGCTNRVTSLLPMEKPCQLMMVPLLLVTLRVLPVWLKEAEPATT
ncbi:MAG: hypothetical protein BWY57_01407 [Betaproteobacteria bacterium ADurb.Bin341]|nr:MAG: hypothetical protein BWY57_01407 [Betaproteobacteria bacterium ADurb.Bin341]